VAPKLLRAVETAPSEQDLLSLLDGLVRDGSSHRLAEAELAEMARVASKLRQIGPAVPGELEAYKLWGPRVACYAFDWYRGDGPGMVTAAEPQR
jgi:hypothetical protein